MDKPDKILNIAVPPELLWFLIAIAVVFFLAMAIIFNYHWKKYGVADNPKIFAKRIFWIISIILVVVMLFSITGFQYF